jgi:hypothetical protein
VTCEGGAGEASAIALRAAGTAGGDVRSVITAAASEAHVAIALHGAFAPASAGAHVRPVAGEVPPQSEAA